MSRRVAIDWVTGRSFDEMELLVAWLNVQSGHHKLSEVRDRLRLRVVLAVIVPTEKEGTGSRWGACAPVFGCDRRRAEGPLRTYVAIRTSHQSPGLSCRCECGLAVFAQLCCLLA